MAMTELGEALSCLTLRAAINTLGVQGAEFICEAESPRALASARSAPIGASDSTALTPLSATEALVGDVYCNGNANVKSVAVAASFADDARPICQHVPYLTGRASTNRHWISVEDEVRWGEATDSMPVKSLALFAGRQPIVAIVASTSRLDALKLAAHLRLPISSRRSVSRQVCELVEACSDAVSAQGKHLRLGQSMPPPRRPASPALTRTGHLLICDRSEWQALKNACPFLGTRPGRFLRLAIEPVCPLLLITPWRVPMRF